jgi:O-antigen ligase
MTIGRLFALTKRNTDKPMGRAFLDFWIRPRFRNYDVTNISFYSLALCMGALLGSIVSIIVISTAVYSTIHLFSGRLRWAGHRNVKLVAFSFGAFFCAEAFSALANPSFTSLNEVVENLTLLGFAGIYSITFVNRRKLMKYVDNSAFLGSILAILALIIWFRDEIRPDLSAGNESVLALLAGLLYIFNIGAAIRLSNIISIFHLVAAYAASTVVIASGTRAIWPVILLTPFFGLLLCRSRKIVILSVPLILILIGSLTVFVFSVSPNLQKRMDALKADIHAIEQGDFSGSLGQRIQIYQAGYDLFLARPILGYGPGNERSEIARRTREIYGRTVAYSHAHNALLNTALRAGLLGVVAFIFLLVTPIVVALRAKKDKAGWFGLYILLSLQLLYLCSGAVGLYLGHDIHDSVYIACTCYSLYLIFGRTPVESSGSPRQ